MCFYVDPVHICDNLNDFCRIVVVDSGEIVEQGSPKELLDSKSSVFYSMAKDAGIV